ncbi:MAG: hypothetical protein LBJ33_00950 [Pseudomonas putida]|jgi:hypothetical protein|nr:hypothetical protein [Pseudomonas putida]
MTTPTDVLTHDPIYTPGLITPVQTDGAVGGVNHNMIHANDAGLLVIVQNYLNMQQGDWIEVFWGDDSTPVAADLVLPEQVGEDFALFIRANRIPEGIHDLYARVTRSGGGNGGESPPLAILVRTEFPGGTDPEPDLPGHQNLAAPEPETYFIDEDAAKNGVKVTIAGYPNMRVFDRITLSWGGELLQHEVTQAEVDAGTLDILVDEATIFEAGASDQLVLVYRVIDEVHNTSSDWSVRTYVTVEVGTNLFDAPMVENPDTDADPYDVIDLEELGDDDLLVNVMAAPGGKLEQGDLITLSWVGTTAQGQPVAFQPPPQSVPRVPVVLMFFIPNADVRQLAHGRGVASYTVTRDDALAGISKRGHVSFIGVEQRLPRPSVTEAVGDMLDPTLASATAVVPGEALEAGDTVKLTWLGARANGTPLMREFVAGVSGGNAGKPMSFSIPGDELIAPLDGGTLRVYYRLVKGSGVELQSEREHLRVGEAQADLPAPFTRPPAEDGVLDPEQLPAQLEIVIAPWPGMSQGQTVYLVWSASSGPYFDDFMPISEPQVGHEVVFRLDRSHVEENLGAEVELFYRVETPGEPTRMSAVATLRVGSHQEIESGPLQVMGARFNIGAWNAACLPRTLSALHPQSLRPMLVEWRYEDSQQWSADTTWNDRKPWLKLYVRSASETWVCNPANVIGTGFQLNNLGKSAFVAMRDEVMGDEGVEVDLVAWGNPEYGGRLDAYLGSLDNVAQLSASIGSFAALLRDGNVACWGLPTHGGTPQTVFGNFVQLRSTASSFAGLDASGEIIAWGDIGVPVPERVLQYRDYTELYSGGGAYAAHRASGEIVAWGRDESGGQMLPGQELYDDIVDVFGNAGAFAALRDNDSGRSVIAWGSGAAGGLVPDEIGRLTNIKTIGVASEAFCALLDTGEVRVWPETSLVALYMPENLRGVSEITGSTAAVCARLENGRVVAWGHPRHGGTMTDEVQAATDVIQVVANMMAFAALRKDGTVIAWGDSECGGFITASVAARLVNVRAIYACASGFTALTKDGRVVTWGVPHGGGNSDGVQWELNGKVTHSRLLPPADD